MSDAELSLRFSGNNQVNVSFDGTDSGCASPSKIHLPPRTGPISAGISRRMALYRWTPPTIRKPSASKPGWSEIGKALFKSVFSSREAGQRFIDFRNSEAEQRVLTIDAQDASILSLPWELLHDPKGVFLFRDRPHISIRRKISGAGGGRTPFPIQGQGSPASALRCQPPRGSRLSRSARRSKGGDRCAGGACAGPRHL